MCSFHSDGGIFQAPGSFHSPHPQRIAVYSPRRRAPYTGGGRCVLGVSEPGIIRTRVSKKAEIWDTPQKEQSPKCVLLLMCLSFVTEFTSLPHNPPNNINYQMQIMYVINGPVNLLHWF